MKLLVLGGTVFLGRHIVDRALARGHDVTLFNRGRHAPGLFPDVEKLRGDRDGDLGALAGRRWDAVVDTCGYVPRVVGASARLLADACDHYTFVSTQSVYADADAEGADESAPVGRLDDPAVEEITGETYGPLKALCEKAAEAALPGRVLHVRPGLIVGPHDPTDRFTYWPVRLARGGEVLAPAPAAWRVEFTDVRDLAAWIVASAEARRPGVFNVSAQQIAFAELLAGADVAWVDVDWLAERGAALWTDLPLRADKQGFSTRSTRKAIAAGFARRPVAETVRDTRDWRGDAPLAAGLTPEREAALLEEWHHG